MTPERLRAAREARAWSLGDLAKQTGLSEQRISNYENGHRKLGVEPGLILARALGISAAYLLCVDEYASLTDDERALIAKYRDLDARGRSTLNAVADAQKPPPDDD